MSDLRIPADRVRKVSSVIQVNLDDPVQDETFYTQHAVNECARAIAEKLFEHKKVTISDDGKTRTYWFSFDVIVPKAAPVEPSGRYKAAFESPAARKLFSDANAVMRRMDFSALDGDR